MFGDLVFGFIPLPAFLYIPVICAHVKINQRTRGFMEHISKLSIIALSDIHGSTSALQSLDNSLSDADLIFLCGDITHFGGAEAAAGLIEPLKIYNTQLYGVSGNCDYPAVNNCLVQENMDLEGKIRPYGRISITGLNGSLPCPGLTPNERSESEYTEVLENFSKLHYNSSTDLVLVTHQPPYGTACDRLCNGRHVGSHAIRRFIEKIQPLICFTGHIHEGIGTDRIGRTVVVNPGPFHGGHYATVILRMADNTTEISDVILHS